MQQGDLATAKHLLGRDYAITGMVEHGDKIGRTLDFPTANIALNRIKPALHGIFAVSVTATDGTDLSTLGRKQSNWRARTHQRQFVWRLQCVGIRPSQKISMG
ncbi:MAG: riboflavin kinase [Moraxella osloensis]